MNDKKKIIMTCGTFDLFHIGHINLLKRAKQFGDYLIVGVSSDKCNNEKNKRSVIPEKQRLEIVKSCKYVDQVFLEDSLTEKKKYIQDYKADLFVIGDDWINKFDFLDCEVKYLTRTEEISTSIIKNNIKNNSITSSIYIKIYTKFHMLLDKILTNLFKNILINPNYISILSLFLFVPIKLINNNYIKCFLFVIHDILDRTDGVMARIYETKNIKRDKEFGAYLDAIFDKIFAILIGIFVINNYLLYFKLFIHAISFYKRTINYLNTKNMKYTKNVSTIYGKMGTFFENIAFLSYFIYPNLFNIFIIFSLGLQIQSLYDKF